MRANADNDLMSFRDISDELGLGGGYSAKVIYERALEKLRLRCGNRKQEITELYERDIEPGERPRDVRWKVSELNLSRYPLLPRPWRRKY